MQRLIIIFIFLFSLVACKQNKDVEYVYYESGKVKEKIIYESADIYEARLYSEKGKLLKVAHYKDGLLNGYCKSYRKNVLVENVNFKNGKRSGRMVIFDTTGKINLIRTFLNDSLYGITKVFDNQGKVKQEYFYIDGKQIMLNEFYNNNGGKLVKMINYILDENGNAESPGQLVYDKINKKPVEDMSFFYSIKHQKDTLQINELNKIHVDFINKYEWKMEVEIGKMNKFLSFIDKPAIYKSDTKKIDFKVKPKHVGLNCIFGKLILIPSNISNPEKTKYTFLFYDEFYVQDN
ncbi:MAG TPA: hypothetical protein VE912_03390 [Bacteroidales bacterium]|nr:hypothetical protein [Bacteroidales bacterium]